MTTSRAIVLSAVFALALPPARALAADGWGASWSFGPSTSRITYAKTTLVPGRIPALGNAGPLFIWPGMSNSKGDLIQTTMNAYANNGNSSYCKATSSQWCVEASVFGSFGQRNGPAVAIDPDDHVTIEYKLESDGNTWTQTVTSQKLGKVVSTLQSSSGPMPGTGFGFATEAQNESFTIDSQYYLCTELHFADADPKFGSTGVGANGAKYGATGTGSGAGSAKNVRTPDGGRTWLVDLITLPAMQPQGTQTPPPAINCGSGGTGGTGGGAGGSGGRGGTGGGSGGTSGGASGSGGTGRFDGGVGGSASGGASGSGGMGSGGRTGGTGGSASGGTSGSGGTGRLDGGVGGSASGGTSTGGTGSGGRGGSTGGTGGSASGGATSDGGVGTAGITSSGGAAGASAGNTGGSTARGGDTGGTSGAGGSGSGGARPGASDSAGTDGQSTAATNDSSGCSCSLQPGARGPGASMLLLGFLIALLSRRRRH